MMGVVVLLALAALVFSIAAYVKVSRLERSWDEHLRSLKTTAKEPPTWVEPPTRASPTPAQEPGPLLQAARITEPRDTRPQAAAAASQAPAARASQQYKQLWALISGGNPFVRIGVLVLFFGVAFLLKYASEHHHLPPQLRLLGAAVLACGLLTVGWRLRERARNYGLVLQGGGVGLLYLTVFASLRLYQLLPADLVFLLLCAVVVFSGALAVVQDALWLAIMASLGGFLAPVLASTGQGNHVVLFSYYLVLSGGIFGIALYRSWRVLNVLGFVCTFIIASAWGALRYRPELFASTEPFLIAFFLLYTAIAVVYALRQVVRLTYYADGSLIFGVPLVGFGLQSAMVSGWHDAMAYSALALALFYLLLAAAIHRWRRELRIVMEAFLALGVGFATLAIPLAFDAYWTSAAWALEGAGIAWSGLRQRRGLLLFSGLALQWAGGIAFLVHDVARPPLSPVINTETFGILLIAVAGLFSGWYMDRTRRREPQHPLARWCEPMAKLAIAWSMLWWLHGGLTEAARLTPGAPVAHIHALLLFASLSLLGFSFAARGLRWPDLGLVALLQTPVMLAALLALSANDAHPFQDWGWFAWPPALIGSYLLLRNLEQYAPAQPLLPLEHCLTLLCVLTAVTWECAWRLPAPRDPVWHPPVDGALPALTLLLLTLRGRAWLRWPVDRYATAYNGWAAAAIALYLWYWLARSNLTADPSGVSPAYLPLLNPLDLAQALGVAAMACWVMALYRGDAVAGIPSPVARSAADLLALALLTGLAAFGCLNGMLIRAFCYWFDIRFDWDAVVDSQMVQMGLSLLWTSCALGVMLYATRRRLRPVWFAGAVLMVAEIAKLFLEDLASAGSLERVVSFIVVGGLLLLIGYFSPLPPMVQTKATS